MAIERLTISVADRPPRDRHRAGPSVQDQCRITLHAYLIRDDDVTRRPAVDLNRIVLGAQVVAVVALLTIRAIVKTRAKVRR
jgi:hypothetical protein